jgi:hypothetical protein
MLSATRHFLVIGAVCWGVVGCTERAPVKTDNDHAMTSAAVPTVSAANGASAAAAPTPGTSAQPTSTSKQSTVKVVAYPPGSRRVVRDGVVYYCSNAPGLGTKIAGPEKCMTEAEAAESERHAKEVLQQMTETTTLGPAASLETR